MEILISFAISTAMSLIGSWLFGPKASKTVFDPGAEEMPRINQSLRGVTVPILFGTNRVACNIVWTKNFTTIRHETTDSAGGGKGGGSGMMKGGGGGTTEASYEYKWDMIFHLGMGPEPYSIFGGWVATERMTDDTLTRVLQGDGTAVGYFRSNVDRPHEAELQFDEAYFGFGGATEQEGADEGIYDNWAYFAAQEGHPCRWPSTYYIGFKQLNLGSSSRVPQLSWEIGPGDLTITHDNEYQSNFLSANVPTYGNVWEFHPGSGGVFIKSRTGETTDALTGVKTPIGGKLFYPVTTSNGAHAFAIINAADATVLVNKSETDFQNDCVSLGLDVSGAYVYGTAGVTCIPVQGTPYFYAYGQDVLSGLESQRAYVLYRIEADDTVTIVGGRSYRSGVPQNDPAPQTIYGISKFGEQNDNDDIIVAVETTQSADRNPRVWRLVATEEVENLNVLIDETPPLGIGDPGPWEAFWTDLSGTDHLRDRFYSRNSYRKANGAFVKGQNIFFLPQVAIDLLPLPAPMWTTWLCSYVGYPEIKYHTDNPGALGNNSLVEDARDGTVSTVGNNDIELTYSRGFVVGVELGQNSITRVLTVTDGTGNFDGGRQDFSHRFRDRDGNLLLYPDTNENNIPYDWIGFEENGLARDGVTVVAANDWVCAPQVIKLTNNSEGMWLILWPFSYTTNADLQTTGSYMHIRAWTWQPFDRIAKLYARAEGSWYDPVSDIGLIEADRFLNVPQVQVPWYDPDTEELFLYGAFKASDPISDRFVVSKIGGLTVGGGTDVLPPYIIYTILTNTVFGFSHDPAKIDQASYLAALRYCDSEDIRVSVQYTREENFLNVVDELLSLYGGFLIESGGYIRFGRQDFATQSPVRVIDNDHLVIDNDGDVPVNIQKAARQDGYNYIKVNFFNRNLEYRQDFVEISDEVDMDFNGIRAREFQAKFVMSPETAYKIAERSLWTNLYAKDVYSFKLGWKDADLEAGDVITLVDSYHHELSTGSRCRIVQWKERKRGVFEVSAVQEVEYAITATRSFFDVKSVGAGNSILSNVEAPRDFRMYELPKEFQGAEANLYVGYNQDSIVMGAYLYASPDNITYSLVGNMQPYIISGIWKQGLPDREPGFVEENIHFYLMPGTGFDPVNTPTYAQTHMLDDISESTRAIGGGIFICGSEALAVEGLTLMGQNQYKAEKVYRGWGGTHVQEHSSGAFWHRHGGGMFVQALNQDRVGTDVYFKVVPYNFAGVQFNVASIDPKLYTIQGDYWKPRPLPEAKLFVSSLITGTASENVIPLTTRAVSSGGSNIVFTWPDASTTKGSGAGGYGAGGYGDFTADVETPSYRVQVMSLNGTVVRSTVVNTQYFAYTRATNSADFNGAVKQFSVKVTPFNSFGDAPNNREYAINLFW